MEDHVVSLDIEWISGSVTVKTHAENTFSVSETADSDMSVQIRLHWWLDGDTLRIRFCKSGRIRPSFLKFSKSLTVFVPEDFSADFVSVETVSADVDFSGIDVKNFSVSTTSGNVDCEVYGADSVYADTISGDINLNLKDASELYVSGTSGDVDVVTSGFTELFEFDTTSGDLNAVLDSVKTVRCESTSGDINVKAMEISVADVDTTSGKIEFDTASVLFEGRFETTSSDVVSVLA